MNGSLKMIVKAACWLALLAIATTGDRWQFGLGPPGWGPWKLVVSHLILAIPAGWWIAKRISNYWLADPLIALLAAGSTFTLPLAHLWHINFYGMEWTLRVTASLTAGTWICLGINPLQQLQKAPILNIALFLLAIAPSAAYSLRIATMAARDSEQMARAGRVIAEAGFQKTFLDTGMVPASEKNRSLIRLAWLEGQASDLRSLLKRNDVTPLEKGVILARLERQPEAIKVLKETREKIGLLLRARLLRESGMYDEAIQEFITLSKTPDAELAWFASMGLAETLAETGRHSEASRLMEETAKRFPVHRSECLIASGSYAAQAGQGMRALQLWTRAEPMEAKATIEVKRLRERLLANSPTCLAGTSY